MKNTYKLLILTATAAFATGTAFAGKDCGNCPSKSKDKEAPVKEKTSLVQTADNSAI